MIKMLEIVVKFFADHEAIVAIIVLVIFLAIVLLFRENKERGLS